MSTGTATIQITRFYRFANFEIVRWPKRLVYINAACLATQRTYIKTDYNSETLSVMHFQTSLNEIEGSFGFPEEKFMYFPLPNMLGLHTSDSSDREPSPMQTQKVTNRSSRVILSEQDARIIFQNKPLQESSDRRRADVLASLYGVSVKTIRDIWVGRTWYRSTCHLDPSKPVNLHRLQRKPGRPLGAKDSKPRVAQPTRHDSHSPLLPSPTLAKDLPASSRRQGPAALAEVWHQTPTGPLADWLDGGSWSISAGWDDPFHDDWPFWNRNGSDPACCAV